MRLIQRCRSFRQKADAHILILKGSFIFRRDIRTGAFRKASGRLDSDSHAQIVLSFTSSNNSSFRHRFFQIQGCAANLPAVRACREFKCNGFMFILSRGSDRPVVPCECQQRSSSILQIKWSMRRKSDSLRWQHSSLKGSGEGQGGHLQGWGRLQQSRGRLIQISGPGRRHGRLSQSLSYTGGHGLHISSAAGSAMVADHSCRTEETEVLEDAADTVCSIRMEVP